MWLAIYTESSGSPPSCVYNIITRQPPSSYSFQKINDPVQPFVPDKTPHHSLLRLRDFPPDLQDLLIVSSSASTEVGLLSRSKKALAADKPADSITGVFTMTELLDDTKRPTLPMTEDMEDSTPIGIGLDLSSKDKVYRPIPSDEEINESPSPLPGLWVLTHEGLLCSWWLVYTDSVKQGTTYPGLTVADTSTASAAPAAPATPSAFGANTGSAFGQPSAPTAAPAFGSSSQMGAKASPWGTSGANAGASQTGGSTFGQPSFGNAASPSTPAFGKPSTFGASSQLGMRTSPWAAAGGSAPAFGQSGFSNFANKSPGGSAFGGGSQGQDESNKSAAAPASGGFASFASQGGFAAAGANKTGGSVFGGNTSESSPFASAGNKDKPSVFGGDKSTASPFPSSGNNGGSSVFGGGAAKPSGENPFGSTPFKLQSSFKPDPATKDDNEKPSSGSGGSMFGSGFGSALHTASEKSKDDEMDAEGSGEQTPQAKPTQSVFGSITSPESTTPQTTPNPFGSKFGNASGASPSPEKSLFGQPTPAPATSGSLFSGKSSGFSWSQQETPKKEPEAPLPPESTSKLVYPLGDSSSSSAASTAPTFGATSTPSKPDDAPLPPDPTSTTPKPEKDDDKRARAEDAPLPPDPSKNTNADGAQADKAGTAQKSTPSFDFLAKPKTDSKSNAQPTSAPLAAGFKPPNNPFAKYVPPPESSTEESGSDEEEGEDDQHDADGEEQEEEEQEEGEEEEIGGGEEDEEEEGESDEEEPEEPTTEQTEQAEEDAGSEGSGVDVAKDLSPQTSGLAVTPSYTPQSSFGGIASTTPATAQPQERSRPLFGEVKGNAPLFSRPKNASPRSPSPLRAVPNRMLKAEGTRSVSAPGMASQIMDPKKSQSQLGQSIVGREKKFEQDYAFIAQHKKNRERQEMEETQPLVDEEDEQIQKLLASEVEGTLMLDEFVAHSNTAPPAQESVPAQVEAVYRDINSMIDTVGLNARTVKAFVKGHSENRQDQGRTKEDLEIADDWILCEVDALGQVLDEDVRADLEDSKLQDLEGKVELCQELSRDLHRLRAKQEDLKKTVAAKVDASQTEIAQSGPLSAEQSAQQNELRREYANFSKLLAETEEALTLLKTRIASVNGPAGRGSQGVPTVEAVMRTITKMTTMVEKRSGDVDVLENQLRKLRLSTVNREESPLSTPQPRKSVMFSPTEGTPSRTFRHSFAGSIGSLGGSPARMTTPRKKVSGFSKEEKSELMDKRARRQAVLDKLKGNVEKRGVQVWNMEEIE